jgi:serine/threonine-protein kinase
MLLVQRYLIESYIGGGGFAHIYRGRDTMFNQRRAIKEAFLYDGPAREQFRLESEFLINAHHPNLVHGYAHFEQGGRMYLVMEYVDGQTLEDIAIDYIRRTHQALPEWQVLDWMVPICEAVHALHIQPAPIIHRDIKPANIKLSREKGIPVLIDLGLAKLYREGMPTVAAALAFTPGYAPPEQYHAAGRTDQRTDVYALGATLFFLLTGYQPTESPARLTVQRLPDPRQLNPKLGALTEAIVLRAMALNADERQQSAAELAADLRAARAALGAPRLVPRLEGGGAVTSGGQVALRKCGRCGASNPATARFCMQCGGPLTFEDSGRLSARMRAKAGADGTTMGVSAQQALPGGSFAGGALPVLAPVAPAAALGVGPAPVPAARLVLDDAATAQQPWRAIPTPPHAPPLVYAPSVAPLLRARAWDRPSRREVEAAASILALLSLVCVALSLTGALWAPLLLFVLLGLALAHWVVGNPWHAALTASPLGDPLAQSAWTRWLLWPGMPLPLEFRLIAFASLGIGYLWLIVSVVQLLWSLVH